MANGTRAFSVDTNMSENRVWQPASAEIAASNIGWLMRETGLSEYHDLHAWTVRDPEAFWGLVLTRLGVRLRRPYDQLLDLSAGVEQARWLVGAELNIADSCFLAPPDSPAVIEYGEHGNRRSLTVAELKTYAGRVTAALQASGIQPGDAVGMALPLTLDSVAAYLGVIQAGAVAVGIADSFSAAEIGVRLTIAGARLVITQDELLRGGKRHQLYERVRASGGTPAVVIPAELTSVTSESGRVLAAGDRWWSDFLVTETSEAVTRRADDLLNVLFSSGTTGEPKAIPWTQLCPIKCASDGHFHQDLRPGDVVAWPTSLGWMMGPWLIFASLMNRATIGLYVGAPQEAGFGRFVEHAGVTMLGVVPSLVAAWRRSGVLDACDWTRLRTLSSTGECSRPDDMWWLMKRAGGRPIIEYCGGTEISGGYLTSAVVLPNRPSTFNTPTLGLDVAILDEAGQPAERGELFVVPPSIGLSTTLLNRDHHSVYYADCPRGPRGEVLRRHGDEMERLADGCYRAHGRVDDTMNLGGIKVSSAEIERVANLAEGIRETAAVAEAPPDGGPSRLILYVVGSREKDAEEVRQDVQRRIRTELNPLFKVDEVRWVDALPRTASNKVMRRMLRGPA